MRTLIVFVLSLGLAGCGDSTHSSSPAQLVDVGQDASVDLNFQFPDNGSDPATEIGSSDTGQQTEDCPITCGSPCEIAWNEDTCFCDCPVDNDCSHLDYCDCFDANGCWTVEIGIVCPCDMECPGHSECVCGAGGGTFVGCAPTSCDPLPFCGVDCSVHFGEDGCPECICPEPVVCGELNYCDCRDESTCSPVVSGPTCGLDCECDGLACGCPSGIFIGCVDESCPAFSAEDCPTTTGECSITIGDDGCAVCACDEPADGCRAIDDYCSCHEAPGCEPLTNEFDCGYECECAPHIDCDCGGTEMLACQPRACEPDLVEGCDIESGRCELVWGADGCAECQCVGEDDVCEGLDFCACFETDGCEPQTDTCLCPCDYECPGYEDCVCVCGGGEYQGCQAF